MKYIAYTLKGLEGTTSWEVSGKKSCEKHVLFTKKKKYVKSALFSYEFVESIRFTGLEDLTDKIKKIKLKIIGKFKVDCIKENNKRLTSQEIKVRIGEIFYNRCFKVDLKNPETIIFLDINNNECFIGRNPVYYKRNYKVRSGRDSINPVIGYSLLKAAGFKTNEILLDPFCSDGVILIEAGLMKGRKLYGFSEDIKNARINSKIAKVKIEFSTNEIDWLDTLFKKESVDKIVTKTPFVSKTKTEEVVGRLTKEFFYQAKYILKKKGLIVTLSPRTELLERYSKEFGFKEKKETEIHVGDMLYKVYIFKKI